MQKRKEEPRFSRSRIAGAPPAARPLAIVSTVDALAESLADRVLNAEFSAGDPLREVQIADDYGVGRHTVRAACSKLAHEGLLQQEPNRGMFVPRVSSADLHDLYWVRGCLEVPAALWIAESGTIPPEAEDRLKDFETLDSSAPWSDVVKADFAFHKALVDAVGNRRLSRIYESLTWEFRLAFAQLRIRYDSPSEIAAEHRKLLNALSSRDSTVAGRAIRNHLDGGLADAIAGAAGQRPAPRQDETIVKSSAEDGDGRSIVPGPGAGT